MSFPSGRAFAVGLLLAGLSSHGFALDTSNWSKVKNGTSKEVTITISDTVKTVGNLWIRPANDTTDGTRLSKKDDKFVLKPKMDYQFYFDTQYGSLSLTCTVDVGGNKTSINVNRIPAVGDNIVVRRTGTITESPLDLNFKGFRDASGPVFMTINP